MLEQFNADIAWGRGRNVTEALDWLQQTPYTINRPILELLKLNPHNIPPEKPKRPEIWDKRNENEKHYQAKLRLWMKDYAKWLNFHWMIQEAELLCDETVYPRDEFYNILKLDFRGRLVVLQSFAYQGDDATRALFLLKSGAPIGEEGIRQLKAHVAARGGGWHWSDTAKPDKLNFEGRIAWTERHLNRLVAIGKRILDGMPLDTHDLPEKDERYQFAAACLELEQALRIGPSFETRLPLVRDASCSGLQHIAMMLRSEDGRYANFYPGNEPCDLYQAVADWVKDNTDLLDGIPDRHHRKIVKRPVMTEFYGSTQHGKAEQIYEELVDLLPAEKRTSEACAAEGERARDLARGVTDAIANIVQSVTIYRTFIEGLCSQYVKAGKSMQWPAPWLTILNPYYKMLFVNASHGRGENRTRVEKWCVGNTNDVDPVAVQKVAANFVHSADAALMHAVALAGRNEDIAILPIHDCWACIAPHAGRLDEIIRDRMIWLHTQHDWLSEAYRTARQELPGANLPELPEKGSYDPENFRKSYFAIS